ncbi:hypothetical protein ACFL3U_04265 [Pseudomonadota bacterium]
MAKKSGDTPLSSRPMDSTIDLDALSDILPSEVDIIDEHVADSTESIVADDFEDHFDFDAGSDVDYSDGDKPLAGSSEISSTSDVSAESDEFADDLASFVGADTKDEGMPSFGADPVAATPGFSAKSFSSSETEEREDSDTDDISESVFETSFGLKATGFKAVKVSIDDEEPVTLGRGAAKHEDKGAAHKVVTPSKYVSDADDKDLGSTGDDAINGGNGTDVIFGRGGDDVINGGQGDDLVRGGHGDDTIGGGGGDDFVKAGKGEDAIEGNSGDDVIDGGHGDDILDGGSGSDTLNGDKGDDVLTYTLGENVGATDYYDGGKGMDTLVIKLTAEEYALYEDELNDLADWIAEEANAKSSSSKQFNDASANSPVHPVYETSFGLNVRHMEDVTVEVIDEEEPPAEEPPVVEEPPSEVTGVITGDGAIPLKNVDVTLAEGSQLTFDITVNVEELPEQYDVFMLHDLSGSFWDDLPNVKAQFAGLFDALTASSDVAFGVGSFVDKPEGTFGSSYSDYVYNTDLAMSTEQMAVQEALDGLRTYSGWDWPEAQMEALVQAALRDEEIGFRDGSQKFAVLFTDAPYHKEGDYAEAGANDYDTELESEDYPDPTVVGKMLIDAGITPIFAVTSSYMAEYQALVDSWGIGAVTELHSDSSNIADAITGGLADAPINLELDTLGDDYGFVSSVEPPIFEDIAPGAYTFTVTMEIPEGAESYSSDALSFEITGYGEVNVDVTIEQVDITGDTTNDTLIGDAGPNGIYGMDGDDTLVGTGGVDQLYGGNGNDSLDGGMAADEITGGDGNDVFVFATGSGEDVVTDFSSGDLLDLRRLSSVSSHTEVLAVASQVGGDTVFDFGDGDTLTLLGVNRDDLLADDILI